MMKYRLLGFAAGAIVPAVVAAQMYRHEIAYRASLPQVPGAAGCGMGMMAVFCLAFFVAPVCGAVGTLVSELVVRR